MARNICFVGTYDYASGGGVPAERFREFDEIPDEVEIWVVNEAHVRLDGRKPARLFQLHPRDWREVERRYLYGRLPPWQNRDCFGRTTDYVDYLRSCGAPVYMQHPYEDIPTSLAYPFEVVEESVGIPLPPAGIKRLWATSSWGYMAALLITEHLQGDAVGSWMIYGGELPLGSMRERLWEWPNLAYYMGLAKGLGIELTLPEFGTSLLSAPHYAWGGQPRPYGSDHWFIPGPARIIEDLGVYRLG